MGLELPEVLWNRCQNQLKNELPEQQYNTWIRPLITDNRQQGEEKHFFLVAPNRFIKEWVKSKFAKRIEELCSHYGGM